MEITEWRPGRAMGVRHVGLVTGTGRFTLRKARGGRTRFTWTERLRFPLLPGRPDHRVRRQAGAASASGSATCGTSRPASDPRSRWRAAATTVTAMRRTPLLLLAAGLAIVGPLGACGDDDDSGSTDGGTAASDQISTDGVSAVLDTARVSEVMGVVFDKAVVAEGSCTFTSTTSETAFTLQVTEQGAQDPAAALETMSATCDADTRRERTFSGAEGGFSCLAGGVPNVVAAGGGVVLVLTGSSREEGVTSEQVEDDLATILEDAIVSYSEG